MSSRRVLCIVPRLPSDLVGGEKIYTYHLLKNLASFRELILVGAWDYPPSIDYTWAKNILSEEKPSRSKVGSVFSLQPSAMYQANTAVIRKLLKKLPKDLDFEAIICMHYFGYREAKAFAEEQNAANGIPLILITHNAETECRRGLASSARNIFESVAFRWDLAKVTFHERRALGYADAVTTITEHDEQALSCFNPFITTITPGYAVREPIGRTPLADRARTVVVLGTFEWEAKKKNIMDFVCAAEKIFSQRSIRLKIVGRASQAFLDELKAFSFVEATGEVESFIPHLNSARIGVVCEEIGGGFKLKSLDYIFNGLPLAAFAGSVEGLDLVAGRDFLEFDSHNDMCHGIAECIDDVAKLQQLAETAENRCAHRFNWLDRGKALAKVIDQALSHSSHQ